MDLLRRVVDARGGLMLLKGIRTVIAETVTTFTTQQGPPLPATTRTYIVYPDKFRVDAELAVPDQERPSQFERRRRRRSMPGRAWVKDPRGVQDAPPPMAAEFASNVRRDIIPLLIAAAEGRLTVRKLPDQTGRDLRPVQVLEISGLQINRVRLMIDSQMLIVGQTYTTPSPLGGQSPGYPQRRSLFGLSVRQRHPGSLRDTAAAERAAGDQAHNHEGLVQRSRSRQPVHPPLITAQCS
jgi:hypothetical protein